MDSREESNKFLFVLVVGCLAAILVIKLVEWVFSLV